MSGPVSAHDVAHEIRSRLHGVGKLKVHKLLYYCQAWHLTWTGEPLFGEPIKAWDNGPVVSTLWGAEEHRPADRPEAARPLDGEHQSVVDYVLGRYGQLTGRDLVTLTHNEPPWRDAARNAVITHDAMRRFFQDDESWRERQARVERIRARPDVHTLGPRPLDEHARAAIRRAVSGERVVER